MIFMEKHIPSCLEDITSLPKDSSGALGFLLLFCLLSTTSKLLGGGAARGEEASLAPSLAVSKVHRLWPSGMAMYPGCLDASQPSSVEAGRRGQGCWSSLTAHTKLHLPDRHLLLQNVFTSYAGIISVKKLLGLHEGTTKICQRLQQREIFFIHLWARSTKMAEQFGAGEREKEA